MKQIQVSANRHFLQTEDGKPFFWLGDTAWEMLHRLNEQEVIHYLDNRKERGINVIQTVILAEEDGLGTPDAFGDLPLIDKDPTRLNPGYFAWVRKCAELALARGQYLGLLPTWGDKVVEGWGVGPVIFNAENARIYGELVGKELKGLPNILWILGGDRKGDGMEALWAAMAAGLRAGRAQEDFITLHPCGGCGSSQWFHASPWLDMNMWQSGHGRLDAPTWEMIAGDYRRTPLKPVLDAEPNYEDHPIDPWSRKWLPEYGRFTDYDVRKQGYRSVFAGGCGYTYGHHTVWQFYDESRKPVNHPAFNWQEAICRPGAAQLIHLRNLMLSRPYFERIPADDLILDGQGEAGEHITATRHQDGSYLMVYLPNPDQSVRLALTSLRFPMQYGWYDPRNGKWYPKGLVPSLESAQFRSPIGGPDWVLVLDSTESGYGNPGEVTG